MTRQIGSKLPSRVGIRWGAATLFSAGRGSVAANCRIVRARTARRCIWLSEAKLHSTTVHAGPTNATYRARNHISEDAARLPGDPEDFAICYQDVLSSYGNLPADIRQSPPKISILSLFAWPGSLLSTDLLRAWADRNTRTP